MKRYTISEKSLQRYKNNYDFCLPEGECPKQHLKEKSWFEADLRTLKEVEFPSGRYECSDLDLRHYILFDGEKIVEWHDDAASNYPEDLTWNRDISLLIEQVERLTELEIKRKLEEIL